MESAQKKSFAGVKVLLMAKAFSDGSGDFAFISKLISMLAKRGC